MFEQLFPHECIYLAARRENGQLAGVLPLVRVRSRLFGHYLISMPFLNYGGPLGEPDAVTALTTRAEALAEASGVQLLEMRCAAPLDLQLPASHRKITVRLDLPSGRDAAPLWRSLGAKARSQVRRPQKEGVVVRFGGDQVAPFFDVFSRHMRDLGTPTQPRRFFEVLAREFLDSVVFGVAYLADRPIAAGCGFRWQSGFELVWASALREHNRLAPNKLLYWSFIELCIAEDVRTFDFGRCTPGSGTHRFKLQWGGQDQPLWWHQKADGRETTPSPTDARFRWGPRIWQRLPVRLATMMGPHIVRYIP